MWMIKCIQGMLYHNFGVVENVIMVFQEKSRKIENILLVYKGENKNIINRL
jgi:hypothetical protein